MYRLDVEEQVSELSRMLVTVYPPKAMSHGTFPGCSEQPKGRGII